MSNEFMREERYIVFKMSDLGNSLKGDEIRRLAREYAEYRQLLRKKPLECLVVEKDWPEYEPTWKAIEARVTGAQPAPSVPREAIEKMLTQLMDIAVSNGANSISMPDEYVEVAAWLCGIPAQPAPSEQDASVRKAWARFSHELHRSPDAPYPGMADAFEQHFSQSFIDREWRMEASTWAAAWKAAKRHCAQPAPIVPDGWQLVPTAESRHPGIYKMLGALHAADNTPGMSEWESYRAMLSEAPEVKP